MLRKHCSGTALRLQYMVLLLRQYSGTALHLRSRGRHLAERPFPHRRGGSALDAVQAVLYSGAAVTLLGISIRVEYSGGVLGWSTTS